MGRQSKRRKNIALKRVETSQPRKASEPLPKPSRTSHPNPLNSPDRSDRETPRAESFTSPPLYYTTMSIPAISILRQRALGAALWIAANLASYYLMRSEVNF